MARAPVRIVGSYLSPYVRKVLACLHVKGVAYEIDPIVPFLGDDRFSQVSPIRRVPVMLSETVTLSDSTVICEYLEERHPEPSLFPRGVGNRARARWLEEFADSRMGEVFVWKLFNQVAINPFVWGEPTDQAVVRRALDEDIPSVLSYLESQLPDDGFLFATPTVADFSIATFFRNAAFSRYTVDPQRWPRTAGFVGRVLALDAFTRLIPFEEKLLRTPLPQHRAVLREMGAPLTADTYGSATPRRGMMKI